VYDLVPEPFSLKVIPLGRRNHVMASNLQNEIKKGMDWDKPPV
jgi:hypothetical protein